MGYIDLPSLPNYNLELQIEEDRESGIERVPLFVSNDISQKKQ